MAERYQREARSALLANRADQSPIDDGIRQGTTDLPVWGKPYDRNRPNTTGFSARKVPGDHEIGFAP